MKKLLFTLLLLTSPVSFAQESKGVIEEIQICAIGPNNPGWKKVVQFKVDGQWFGFWADHYGTSNDYDDNLSASLVFMAYSQRLPIHIKATNSWEKDMKHCGITEGASFHQRASDFIRISR